MRLNNSFMQVVSEFFILFFMQSGFFIYLCSIF